MCVLSKRLPDAHRWTFGFVASTHVPESVLDEGFCFSLLTIGPAPRGRRGRSHTLLDLSFPMFQRRRFIWRYVRKGLKVPHSFGLTFSNVSASSIHLG